ncbi:MAG: hypothetical protein JO290_00505 [Sphingomonadaceae bacterium]|nr:hypothetical protein [Sphingomonadaceae bacterium]
MPNTFRHTCHTNCETVGVPPAQIDLAAGHAPRKGSGRNYSHLRPEYLREFVAAIEGYWAEMDRLTTVHRRNHGGTKIAYLPSARPVAIKSGTGDQ